ncbi:hypothetical protein BGZ76_007788, partial [Entomortierella beljakovae]
NSEYRYPSDEDAIDMALFEDPPSPPCLDQTEAHQLPNQPLDNAIINPSINPTLEILLQKKYNHESSIFFPNGDVEYSTVVKADSKSYEINIIGWAVVCYGNSNG